MTETTAQVGALRRRQKELEADVRRLEGQVAHLEKSLDARDDEALGKKLGALQQSLDDAQAELDRVTDELEGAEHAVAEQAESLEELEQLVDSFAEVTRRAPELETVLTAMRHTVGALATARRLERAQPQLTEATDITRSLTQALSLLADALSKAGTQQALRTPTR